MKKSVLLSILSILLLQVPVKVFAQVPNSSFETWSSTPYNDLDNWQTGNKDAIPQMGISTVTKVTGHTGFAVRMQTTVVGPDTGQAFITNGDPMKGEGGIPCSQQPTAITGYYRYNLAGNDSAILLVIFKSNGAVISADFFKFRGSGSQNTFAFFSFPLSLAGTPDTVIIAAASSNLLDGVGIENGSFLELDELGFAGASVNIDNSDFENWTATSLDIPSGWETSGDAITRTTDSHSGTYAIRMMTVDRGNGEISSSGISTGHNNNNGPTTGGLPYTSMNDTLTGYYKYITSGSDSASISVTLTNNSVNVSGGGLFLSAAANYTYFEIPVNSGSTPDTMRIDISSSKWPQTASSAGSILFIDDLELKSHLLLGINMDKKNAQRVYTFPNPATNFLNFTLTKKVTGSVHVSVYDACGRLIREENIESFGNHFQLNVSDLSPGLYYYDVITGDDHMLSKFAKQ